MIRLIKQIGSFCLVALFMVAIVVGSSAAEDVSIYPTIPGTNFRDYSRPGIKIEGNNVYPTIPGTNFRDYSRPGARIEGNNIYPTVPGTNFRDYSRPGLIIEDED